MGYMTEMGILSKEKVGLANKATRGPWLFPYRQTALLLGLEANVASNRFSERIREGDPKHLDLGNSYRIWRRPSGFLVFARSLGWVNAYSPFVSVTFSPKGDQTEFGITFVSPGVLLLLAWLVIALGVLGTSHNWGVMLVFAVGAFGVHLASYMAYLREYRSIADDLVEVVADVATIEPVPRS